MNSKEKRKKWPLIEDGEVYQSPVEYEVLARMTKKEARLLYAQMLLKCFREVCMDLLADEALLEKHLDEFGEKLNYLCAKKMAERAVLTLVDIETLTKLSGFWMRYLAFVPPKEAVEEPSNLGRFVAKHKLGGFLPITMLVLLTTLL